jgi:hypothetical protein
MWMSLNRRRVFFGTLALLSMCATVAATGVAQARTDGTARAAAATSLPCDPITRFRVGQFSTPTNVTNQFYPLVPGTKLVFEGESEGTPHRVVFIVSDMIKVIRDIPTVVYWERDFSDGQLVETELAFRAQDNTGHVWHMGEYPESFEDGQFVEALPWIAGLADAKPGNIMLANPTTSKPKYLQGYGPEVEFLDCAKVFATGQNVCVPAGCFSNVLITNETSPPEPGSQRKYYAPGIGNIKVTDPINPAGEFLDLVEIAHLDEDAMEDVRDAVIRLDERGFNKSESYAQSNPVELASPPGGGGGGSTQTFTPSNDAYVRSAYPAENNGAAATLRTYTASGKETRSYLMFNVSGLSGAATSAKLRLFVKDASPSGGALHQTSNSWSEATLTWGTPAPALGTLIQNVGQATLGSWVEIDVSSYVTGNGTWSFAIAGISTDVAYYSSKEGTNPPELVVAS